MELPPLACEWEDEMEKRVNVKTNVVVYSVSDSCPCYLTVDVIGVLSPLIMVGECKDKYLVYSVSDS